MIGVDPAQQGNGYGSMRLSKCDGEGKVAYRDVASEKYIPL